MSIFFRMSWTRCHASGNKFCEESHGSLVHSMVLTMALRIEQKLAICVYPDGPSTFIQVLFCHGSEPNQNRLRSAHSSGTYVEACDARRQRLSQLTNETVFFPVPLISPARSPRVGASLNGAHASPYVRGEERMQGADSSGDDCRIALPAGGGTR